jgi:hypothetical protein
VLLEQVEQPAPVGRTQDSFGLGRHRGATTTRAAFGCGVRRRLVRAGVVGGCLPHLLQALLAGSLGDLSGDLERGRVGVVLGIAFLASDRPPRVQRDLCLAQLVGELIALGLHLQVGRRFQRVVRGERLERPAIRQQVAVEPRVGRLVEDDEVVGVVGDLDVAAGRVEQAGVPAGGPADGFLDDQAFVARPR